MDFIYSAYRFLGSLKCAVLVILALAAISAAGTFVEANYDAFTAQVWVYQSWYMYLTMVLLIVCLVFSAVERLPWKTKHIPFVTAHIGIIILLFGAFLTQQRGIDGSLALSIGESSRGVVLPKVTDIAVQQTADGDNKSEIFRQEVEFLKNPPSRENPLLIKAPGGDELRVVDFYPYALQETTVRPTETASAGPALRFQLKNANVDVVEWVMQESSGPGVFNMGPAKVVLSSDPKAAIPEGNAIFVSPVASSEKLHYKIQSQKGGVKSGIAKIGEVIETGWMGLQFRAIQYYPHASYNYNFKKLDAPNAKSTSAITVSFLGREHTLGLNSAIRLISDKLGYVFSYQNRMIDLGTDIKLNKFHVGRYAGTAMAMSYESDVEVAGLGARTISMNEPLKHKGYTYYQASFQEDETGKPMISILSVNYDPGRWLKYFGAALILIGALMLFYFKKYMTPKANVPAGSAQ